MIYTHTEDNLIALMQQIGVVKKSQLINFFRNELGSGTAEALIYDLCVRRILRADKENSELIRYHAAPPMTSEVERRSIYAFYILAEMGSDQVCQLIRLEYPMQFLVLTHDKKAYDITVVTDYSEAAVASQIIRRSRLNGEKDPITHVALLYDKSMSKELSGTDFDCWSVINRRTEAPEYGYFGG